MSVSWACWGWEFECSRLSAEINFSILEFDENYLQHSIFLDAIKSLCCWVSRNSIGFMMTILNSTHNFTIFVQDFLPCRKTKEAKNSFIARVWSWCSIQFNSQVSTAIKSRPESRVLHGVKQKTTRYAVETSIINYFTFNVAVNAHCAHLFESIMSCRLSLELWKCPFYACKEMKLLWRRVNLEYFIAPVILRLEILCAELLGWQNMCKRKKKRKTSLTRAR